MAELNFETPVYIRPARPEEVAAIVDLLADDDLGRGRERPGDDLHPDYLAAFAVISGHPDHALQVAVAGDEVLGCLQLSFLPGLSRRGMWRGQVEGVRVARQARDRGIGRLLMQWAIDACRQRGCGLVQLTSDVRRTDAARFYRSLGFVDSHLGFKLDLPPGDG